MLKTMFWLYWMSVAFLTYTFVGYPLLLWMVSIGRRQQHVRSAFWPSVTIIIPAHNEARLLRRKIRNTLDLTYPAAKREVIVASDASDDGTDDIVRSFGPEGVQLLRISKRRGKHHSQMIARDASHGEILFFTDASVELEADTLQEIVSNFADPSIGCVSSVDWVPSEKRAWTGERLYVALEMWLRRLEGQAGSLVGASGSCFAARREVCRDWHPEQSSDFFLPLHTVRAGMRTVSDSECRARYWLVPSAKAELHRKVRTIVHGLQVLFVHRGLLNPFRYGFFSVQLVSHKLFRWLVPFAALCLLASNALLWKASAFYRFTLLGQLAFYGIGLLALSASRLAEFTPTRAIRFFLLGNAATVLAWLYYLWGERFVAWEPSRRPRKA